MAAIVTVQRHWTRSVFHGLLARPGLAETESSTLAGRRVRGHGGEGWGFESLGARSSFVRRSSLKEGLPGGIWADRRGPTAKPTPSAGPGFSTWLPAAVEEQRSADADAARGGQRYVGGVLRSCSSLT